MRKPTNNTVPALRLPVPEIEDAGAVRFGNSNVTAAFPPLKRPAPEIEDRGTVRMGNSNMTWELPA